MLVELQAQKEILQAALLLHKAQHRLRVIGAIAASDSAKRLMEDAHALAHGIAPLEAGR